MTPQRVSVSGVPQSDAQAQAAAAIVNNAIALGHTVTINEETSIPVADMVVAIGKGGHVPVGKAGITIHEDGSATQHHGNGSITQYIP